MRISPIPHERGSAVPDVLNRKPLPEPSAVARLTAPSRADPEGPAKLMRHPVRTPLCGDKCSNELFRPARARKQSNELVIRP